MAICEQCLGKGSVLIGDVCPSCKGQKVRHIQRDAGFESSAPTTWYTVPCHLCNESGKVNAALRTCNRCDGTGETRTIYRNRTCPKCSGSGQLMYENGEKYVSGAPKLAPGTCDFCKGAKLVKLPIIVAASSPEF